jgi:exoribonuclease R
MYQIQIHKRDYTSYDIIPPIDKIINPFHEKLFHSDTFSLLNEKIEIKDSILRKKKKIQGILILQSNKTFGSYSKRLLYKCVPNEINLPEFLIPYIQKYNFQKTFTNLFINFEFKEWIGKHPIGTIVDIIGPVDDNPSLFEYELYCKNLQSSLNIFNKTILPILPTNQINKEERTFIFTIDPYGCVDFDDAFSIDNDKVCIYISNVPLFFEKMGNKGWDIFSLQKRISTIYLPHTKKPLLPNILSDDLCSLKQGKWRETLVMEINKENIITFYNKCVYISYNFIYEEPNLLYHSHYQLLLEKGKQLLSLYPYIENINDSHELVSYFMIFMNHQIGLRLSSGIFRVTKENITNTNISLKPFLNEWNSNYSGLYTFIDKKKREKVFHEALQLEYYTHITSPIRRLVDIINLILFQQEMKLFNFSLSAKKFVEKWIREIKYINETFHQIKKIQNKCNFIHSIQNETNTSGYIFEKEKETYSVYLPSLKSIYYLKSMEEIEFYKEYNFCIHVFEDEDKMKKRIRLVIN